MSKSSTSIECAAAAAWSRRCHELLESVAPMQLLCDRSSAMYYLFLLITVSVAVAADARSAAFVVELFVAAREHTLTRILGLGGPPLMVGPIPPPLC